MKPAVTYPGTKQHQDLDVIVADDVRIDLSGELQRLCELFASLNERATVIIPYDDEGDIVLESLAQLSIRYHPLAQTSPAIVDSMRILAGSPDEAEIAAAGNANRSADAETISRLLDRCVRYAVVANVEFQRRHFWAVDEVLHRVRALPMDIYTRTHGGFRGYHFFDIHADEWLQQKPGAALPARPVSSHPLTWTNIAFIIIYTTAWLSTLSIYWNNRPGWIYRR